MPKQYTVGLGVDQVIVMVGRWPGLGSDPRVGTLVIKVGRRSEECQSSIR